MRELGQRLREHRIELGIDLDEVQAKTKIRKRYLLALEDGDWSALPGEVYARGFIRSYAEVLGLDGMALLREYVAEAPDSSNPEPVLEAEDGMGTGPMSAPQATDPLPKKGAESAQSDLNAVKLPPKADSEPFTGGISRPRQRRRQVPSISFGGTSQVAVVVGILLVIGAGWYFLNHSGGKAGSNAPGPSNLSSPGNNALTATGSNNATSTNSIGVSNNTPAVNSVTPANTANTVANNPPANSSTGNNLGNAAGPSSTNTSITTGPYQNYLQQYVVHTTGAMAVQVTANSGNCWLAVTSDGSVVDPSDTLQVGQTKTWTANQTLQLHVGAAQAISVLVNGVPVSLPNVQGAMYIQFTKSSS